MNEDDFYRDFDAFLQANVLGENLEDTMQNISSQLPYRFEDMEEYAREWAREQFA